jgi:2-desacetyl-2-hydroxyethyl bacteriochlorophyllide A dehydrogenase
MQSVYIVFPAPGKVELQEEAVSPPGPNEILCAAEKSLISIGTESYCLQGRFDTGTNWESWVKYPFRPGYSMTGRVVAVGHAVTGFKEGDRIMAWTPHQQLFKIPAHRAYLVPDNISSEEATWGALACTTQLGVRRASLQLGETVGLIGLGMLGQLVVQYLWLSGARHIIAIDPIESRLEVARTHGATHTLALDVKAARAAIAELTGGKMLDVIFDITGHPAVLAPAIGLLRRLGRVILLGDTPTPTEQRLGPGVVSNSIAILGIHGTMSPAHASEFNPWTTAEMTALFFDYLSQGRMRVADLITHRYAPAAAPDLYRGLLEDRSSALGIIFDWSLL